MNKHFENIEQFLKADLFLHRNFVFKTILSLVLLSSSLSTNAQKLIATPDATQIPLNYSFKINYQTTKGKIEKFIIPKVNGFKVSGPDVINQTIITNGKFSHTIIYSYIFTPKQKGTFTIPPFTAVVNGKQIKSNSVTVKITAEEEYVDPFEDAMKRMEEMMEEPQESSYTEAELNQYLANRLFVRVVPTKTTLYQGEQTTLSYKIYSLVTCNGIMATKMPNFNNFISEEFKLPEQQEPKIEVLNGRQYQTLEVRRITLFPQKTGKIYIEPLELSANVLLGYEAYQYAFKSNAVTLDVMPLPEKNKPASYNGAVGNFSFSAEYDKTKCTIDEPVSLKLTYTGSGNFKMITPQKIQFSEKFENYVPKAIDNYTNNGTAIEGSKTFEYIFVPKDGGLYKLPKYEFSYFNVDEGTYVTYTLPETTLEVSGKAKLSDNIINFFKREEANKPRSIYGIKTQYTKHNKFVGSTGFWTLTTLPVLFLFIGFFFRKKDYSDSDLLSMRRKKANKIALSRMAAAKKILQQRKEKDFYNEIIRALWQYLSDKLHIPQSELSKENIAEKLKEENIAENKINDLHSTLDTCEQALFSPIGQANAMQDTYNKAIELIMDLEEELKRK